MPRRTDALHAADPVARSNLVDRILTNGILILAPHMDDETLACGGTMLLHADKRKVHCLFATDGSRSPTPPLPWMGDRDPALAGIRRREALEVAGRIGVPESNLRFLDFPDSRLATRHEQLSVAIARTIDELRPEFLLAPFRYDVHPDHTALNRAVRVALRGRPSSPALLEYFVYHRLRWMPDGDVRQAIDGRELIRIDTASVATAKRDALDVYRSQTTVLYPWQNRPILTVDSLNRRCAEPEYFLPSDPSAPVSDGLRAGGLGIRLACLAMRYGKPQKERVKALLQWAMQR